jgi:O-succinylbenzoic acid--CoA ligase
VNRLVALAMPGGVSFVTALQRAWHEGDAVLPIDTRLPPTAVEQLRDQLAPALVVDEHGDVTTRAGAVPVEAGDALVMATSGTTGTPKGVVLTHTALEASSRASNRRLGIDPDRHRWIACLPVAHIGGLSVVLRALQSGTPVDVLPRFDADEVARRADPDATFTSLVATTLPRVDAARFATILLGGSAPPDDVPDNCVVTYGMTETASGIWYDDRPLDGVEVRVPADGEHAGEILVRGPMLLRAYRDGTDPKTADGWLPTGDLGTLEDGTLRVHGRRGDMIVSGGENVWPAAVEAALGNHPAVAEVMVVGRPDAEWGHAVTAIVVPRPDLPVPTVEELRQHARPFLAPYALPRRVELAASLPRTALGKLRRG